MSMSPPAEPSIFDGRPGRAPLSARMRPRGIEEVQGQQHLLARGRALRESIEAGDTGSILLWGPPGSGKTTLARLLARYAKAEFVEFSAVMEGVPRIREIVADAVRRLARGGARTILFVDEIHRFNRGQQDALLPHVESGTLTLVGATTENPSFELTSALLSRLRVFVLEPLEISDLKAVITRAMRDTVNGLGAQEIAMTDDALALLATECDGDARRALTVLDAAVHLARGAHAESVSAKLAVTVSTIREALQLRFAHYDKSGEEHFNLMSAYHKSLRGSDAQAALYWLARMIQGGEDPMYIARRGVRFAVEDIGLADPRALEIAVAARDAFHFLGSPEGELALAEATIYLATSPKSNRVYAAWTAATDAARATPSAAVPKHIRNAPTALMKELGYSAGYKNADDAPQAYFPQDYLPDAVGGAVFYEPTGFGFEEKITKRLDWWANQKRRTTEENEK